MARIQIDLPESFLFSTEIPIYIQHINYGHHVDNAGLLSLVAEGRVRFLKSMGYTELNTEGCGLIVADAAVQYRSEAFHGETLVADFAVADFNKYGCDFVWRLLDKASGREVARGKHGIMFFDYTARKPALLPQAFVDRVSGQRGA